MGVIWVSMIRVVGEGMNGSSSLVTTRQGHGVPVLQCLAVQAAGGPGISEGRRCVPGGGADDALAGVLEKKPPGSGICGR